MAPRKRQKVARIDAALDAMRPMGFSDSVVRKTVRDLLKTYEGNDGWPFIEDSAYRVLIETLLDRAKEEEEHEQEQDLGEQDEQQNPQPVIEHDDEAGVFVTDEAICEGRKKVDHHPYEHSVVDEDVYQQDVADKENHFPSQDEKLPSNFGGNAHFARARTPPLVDCPPTIRRCKPCYGWISDDDDIALVNPSCVEIRNDVDDLL